MNFIRLQYFIMLFWGFASSRVMAFEDTRILPKGVRNLTIKVINTTINSLTNGQGLTQPLATPLLRKIKFSDLIAEEKTALKKAQIKGFLANEGLKEDDVVGQINAEMEGELNVVVPLFSYGLLKNYTLAVAIPYFKAGVKTAMGFTPSSKAQKFLDALARPENNQIASARLAGKQINGAIKSLNNKLENLGYSAISDWSGQGIGDVIIGGKYLFLNRPQLKMATSHGVVLATGRNDDPNILNDIPFGDGSHDVFASIIIDEPIHKNITLNQNVKYTYQLASKNEYRLKTLDENVEVLSETINYKHGDKIEGGLSIQSEMDSGFITSIGAVYFHKFKDNFSVALNSVKEALEENTNQVSTFLEARIGYSGIKAYQNGLIPVPFFTTFEFKKHISSKNMPASDIFTFDMALFF